MAQLNTLQTFVDKILETVPEDQRESVRSLYSKASDEVRSLEEASARVRATAEEQNRWWEANKAALEDYKTLKGAKPAADDNPITEAVITKQLGDLEDRVMGTGLTLMGRLSHIGLNHMREFNEVLDTEKLLTDAVKAGKPLDVYYTESVTDRRQKAAEERRQAELTAAREEGRKEGTAEAMKRNPALPFPGPSAASASPTTLAGLAKPAEGQANPFSLEAAVATAMETANK